MPASMARAGLYWGSALLAGSALGLGATALVLQGGSGASTVRAGAWETSLLAGSPDADPWTRAVVARKGLLALVPEETLYYTAREDSAGRVLDGSCRYRLDGWDPGARWWSLTAYGADDYLIPNPDGRYSISQSTIVRRPDHSWSLTVGPDAEGGNWLPVRAGEPFDLTLRLYNPETEVYAEPAGIALPVITRESCR
ncbi:MAG: DUF1214 domain-containing protein [Gammaproteobacteria bacterium]